MNQLFDDHQYYDLELLFQLQPPFKFMKINYHNKYLFYYFNKFVHTEELSRAILFSSDDCDFFDVSFELELFE